MLTKTTANEKKKQLSFYYFYKRREIEYFLKPYRLKEVIKKFTPIQKNQDPSCLRDSELIISAKKFKNGILNESQKK